MVGLVRRVTGPLARALLVVASATSAVACRRADADYEWCAQATFANDPDCQADVVATTTVTGPADCESTGGTCVDEAPDGWFGPNLYWIGPPDEKPGCPDAAKLSGAEAYGDLGAVAHTCPACDCGPSETVCIPPTKWTLSAAKCSDAGNAFQTSFDVLAPDWAGTCNADNAVGPGALCGDMPCVQSVTVAAPQVVSAPCAPQTVGLGDSPGPPWPWGKVAQECLVTPSDTCTAGDTGEGQACLPVPTGFLACISLDHGDHEGDVDCPAFYGEKHVLYRDAEDTRACAPCDCGAAEGAECAVTAMIYEDTQCLDFTAGGVVFSGDGQACHDVSAGVALGSKAAEIEIVTPGACAPTGGEAEGGVVPVRRVTLCCHADVPA